MHNIYSLCIMTVLTVGYAHAKAFPSETQCGIVNRRKGRIIHGEIAQIAQLPWMASIKHNNVHRCGGSIISNKYIISASHCFENELNLYGPLVEARSSSISSNYTVTLGEHNQLVEEDYSVNYTISRMIFHKNYERSPLVNDILLLELNEEIVWTDHIQPICLPKENIQTSLTATAAGWGRDIDPDVSYESNKKLRYIGLQIFHNDLCNNIYAERGLSHHLRNTQMCAGNTDVEYRDTNDGDSGGPLEVNIKGREVLVGITSFGTLESIPPKAPGIYTRVFEYLNWIEEHIRPNYHSSSEALSNSLI